MNLPYLCHSQMALGEVFHFTALKFHIFQSALKEKAKNDAC